MDYEATENNNSKIMYKRNLEILHNYEDFDFSAWRPPGQLNFLSKSKVPLLIENIPFQIIPHQVFSYGESDSPSVGGIWFEIWLEGFRLSDLGIFSQALFKYLSHNYSRDYVVDPKYCLIIDTLSKEAVNYQRNLDKEIPSMLQSTIDNLKKYLV